MATPNDPVPPKKPATPAGKPGEKPVTNIKPAAPGAKPPVPGAKPPAPGAKPQAARPGKPGDDKVTGNKPADGKPKPPTPQKKAPVPAKGAQSRGGTRKLGQVLIDLGFIDEDQLREVLDEGKNSGTQTGQAAVARGLITEEQLIQALADQHGLKLVNTEEVKPQAEALQLVTETMASVYKIVPLALKDKVLT